MVEHELYRKLFRAVDIFCRPYFCFDSLDENARRGKKDQNRSTYFNFPDRSLGICYRKIYRKLYNLCFGFFSEFFIFRPDNDFRHSRLRNVFFKLYRKFAGRSGDDIDSYIYLFSHFFPCRRRRRDFRRAFRHDGGGVLHGLLPDVDTVCFQIYSYI